MSRPARKIQKIEKEWGDSIENIIYELRNFPDASGHIFSDEDIANILDITSAYVRQIAKRDNIAPSDYPLHLIGMPTPLEDFCQSRFGVSFRGFLRASFYNTRISELALILCTTQDDVMSNLNRFGYYGGKKWRAR